MAAISGGDVHLAVDVSGVTFIGAAGIGVLVAAGAAAAGRLSPGRDPAVRPALRWPLRCRQRRLTPPGPGPRLSCPRPRDAPRRSRTLVPAGGGDAAGRDRHG
jgi:hypothetical protein